MTKLKTSVTLDPEKIAKVRRITGAPSTSAAIDIALAEMIETSTIRGDVLAYRGIPPDDSDLALARTSPTWSDLEDQTDWDALYAEER